LRSKANGATLTLPNIEKLYKGLNSAQLESSDTTRYKWSFAKNLDKMEMDTVRDSVDSMTSQSRGDDKIRQLAGGRRRAQAVGPTMPDTVGTFFFYCFIYLSAFH
jgi:hypothetical protein